MDTRLAWSQGHSVSVGPGQVPGAQVPTLHPRHHTPSSPLSGLCLRAACSGPGQGNTGTGNRVKMAPESPAQAAHSRQANTIRGHRQGHQEIWMATKKYVDIYFKDVEIS